MIPANLPLPDRAAFRWTRAVLRLALVLAAGSSLPAATINEAREAVPLPFETAEEPSVSISAAERSATPADQTQGLLTLGNTFTDRGEFETAEIAFRQILNSPHAGLPETKKALLSLARMHRMKGEPTKAAAIYERYLKDYPDDIKIPDTLIDLGRTLRTMGVHRLAIARFYSVIHSVTNLSSEGFDHYLRLANTARFEIAETHLQAAQYAEANKFYGRLRLLDLAPSDRAHAHFKAGYSQHLAGDHTGAVNTLRSFLGDWPDDGNVPEARYLLAVSLNTLKRKQEALSETLVLLRAEQARVESDPRRWAYWQFRTGNQLANEFFESGDTMSAHAIYLGLVALSDDPAWRLPITYQVALCYERLGVTDRARETYQQVIDGAGKTPPPEFAELARMASWRSSHLEWHDAIVPQVASFLSSAQHHLPVDSTPPVGKPAGAL